MHNYLCITWFVDTVNSVSFTPDGSHVITVSSDGTIGIIRCGSWQLEKHWLKPHKGMAVDMLAVHPTGKLAMTTGHDGVLRTWNLVKGRQAYATNLVPRWKMDAKQISVLKWSPDGLKYLLAANNRIDIYSIETAGIQEEIAFDSKVVCAEYSSDQLITVGLADGKLVIYDLESSSKLVEIQAHVARVKCLAVKDDKLVSASSSGEIKLWSIGTDKLTLLNKVNCSARISCLTLNSCAGMQYKKPEIIVEEKVPERPSNKLRSKQIVTIEVEGEEPTPEPIKQGPTRLSKKKRDKKKARKLLEETNQENENTQPTKKAKKSTGEGSSPKNKNKNSEEDSPLQSQKKKKKLSVIPQKRKSDDEEDDTELPIKKKKKKVQQDKSIEAKNHNKVQTNKKKRKNPPEDTTNDSPKKQKVLAKTTNVTSLQKKRKKKQFKNKVPR